MTDTELTKMIENLILQMGWLNYSNEARRKALAEINVISSALAEAAEELLNLIPIEDTEESENVTR